MQSSNSKSESVFRCIAGCTTLDLTEAAYSCPTCGSLLEVYHDPSVFERHDAAGWKALFSGRIPGSPGPLGSGVWRFHEWVLPSLPLEHVVSLGEGATPLMATPRLSDTLGVELLIKQCGQSLSGSFKDLGMTVLMSQVNHIRKTSGTITAVVCASTGDTSAALAAYGAAAGIVTLVLLPRGKISAAQLAQPLAHGARVLQIDTDFDGCMAHVQKLASEGVYLANSKNSLRIEGQKTVAFEICLQLGFSIPDWVAIPGGNLGNVSALVRGFDTLKRCGIIERVPRILCVQAEAANPLFVSYESSFAPLQPMMARATAASAIRIGNPVSFPKAVAALQSSRGVVDSASEQALTEAAQLCDHHGMYTCPHTAVAVAGVRQQIAKGTIKRGEKVVVVATAHGLKFTEFKVQTVENRVPSVALRSKSQPIEVADDYDAVRRAALEGA